MVLRAGLMRTRLVSLYCSLGEESLSLATCSKENKWTIKGRNYKFSEFQCAKKYKPIATQRTNNQCGKGLLRYVSIGYEVGSGKWVDLITSCYDHYEITTFYSIHTLSPDNEGGKLNQHNNIGCAHALEFLGAFNRLTTPETA